MVHQLQQTDLSIHSLEMRFPQKFPLTSVIDIDPKNYHDFFAPNNEGLLNYRKTVSLLILSWTHRRQNFKGKDLLLQ